MIKRTSPLVKEIRIDDDVSGLVIRLWADKDDDGKHWMVEFAVVAIIGAQGFDPLYGGVSGFPTTDLDYAEPVAHGSFKWDGCTQLSVAAHVCTRHQMTRLFDAIQQAREESSRLPGMKGLAEEYTPDYTSDSY